MEQKNLKGNIWKYFLFNLTQRRNYIPLLSLYFLTLPNSTAQQIGLYTGIGWLAGFLLEIPSGYLSDRFGHKKALIISSIAMTISTLCFIVGDSLPYFIAGSVFITIGFSMSSGTATAFFHNTLIGLKRDKEYSEIESKIRANVSLVSIFMILLLPLLTKISILMPIKIYIIFDIIGIIVAFSLYSPKIKISAEDEEGSNIIHQLKRFYGTGFYTTSIFLGLIGGFMMGLTSFHIPYATKLGLPIVFAGALMASSRFIWFIIGQNIKKLKNIKMKNLFLFELIFFPSMIIIASQVKSMYLFIGIFAITIGYFHARSPLLTDYYFKHFLFNKKYKATMLSIKHQISKLFESIISFGVGIIMGVSFKFGYLVAGITFLVCLIIAYLFLRKYMK